MEWATSNGVPFYQPDLSAFKKAEVARGMKASTVNVRLAGGSARLPRLAE